MVQLGRRLFASAGQGSAPPDWPGASAVGCLDLVSLLSARFAGISADRVDAEIEAGLRQVLEFFEVDLCVLFEVSAEGTKISAAHLVGNPGLSMPLTLSVCELFPWSVQSVIRSVGALRLHPPDALPADATKDRASCEHWALKSMLLIPLRAAGVVRSIIAVAGAQRERELPEECIPWLRLLGDIFMNALDRRAMEEAQKKTEKALRESEQRLALTQRVARLGTLEWDTASGRITASEEACRIFGIASNEYANPRLGRVIHPDDRSALQEAIGRTLSNGNARFCLEYRIVRPDGTERIIQDQGEVTDLSDAAPAKVIRTVQDVTESRQGERELQRLRSQLWHTDRVVHVGALTASLAHELNQPLAAVLCNAQAGLRFLAGGAPDLEELGDILQDVVRDTKRAGAVISGLRTMVRRQEIERTRIDLAESLREVLELLHGEFVTHQVEVAAQFDANCAVLADNTQIQQVTLNLVMNAIDAMREQSAEQRRCLHVSLSYSGEGAVRVAVRDSGGGMPREKLSTVFDAFWTTKPQGMGLGLAVCRAIVEAHGGTIWAEANRDRGVTFIFELPAAPRLAAGDAAGLAEAAG
ncbi:ATP-binding protein [Aromatoleum sp.]|uniref:ATP-binding protein n=1 Tax=Aromatoleum sp. TaxID=2307007 RepID=UPI002FC803A0